MSFVARKGKQGVLEVHGLESFIERKIKELTRALGIGTPPKRARAAAKAKPAEVPKDALARLEAALKSHRRAAALTKAGRSKDQLFRSLVPLYLGRGLGLQISSGVTSKFWARHGVRFAPPNAAKALREHAGHSTRSKHGPAITAKGVAYVEGVAAGKPVSR